MKYGVCAGYNDFLRARGAGADYVECTVVGMNGLSEEEVKACARDLELLGFRCEALNVLFPGNIRLTGPEADNGIIKEYLAKSFKHISVLQPSVVVFGSGGARRYPDGYPKERALSQFTDSCRFAAEAAQPYHITVAVEPLNSGETNLINSIAEAYGVVVAAGCSNLGITADYYHMLVGNEPILSLVEYGNAIAHAHIATKDGRVCPAEADLELFAPFFKALRKIGYDKRISIEGSIDDFGRQVPEAVALMRKWASS